MTESEIKSGQQILDEFFGGLATEETVDTDTISAIVDLFNKGKLTSTNLSNALSALREVVTNDQD